ncbi:hypothetical protein [Microbacterium sp. Root280D1]|uniref:hypothetical protein n=1 Tax=Microbacterium sp. Root280D1 TaxID=1736510 RepID=UPI0006FBA6B4|nr:hypothetical protein [Microbacterium sp. Root280D1]KRD53743.1 hypothetical protein ASE34_01155 [Microbacterium sp. Root280D1]
MKKWFRGKHLSLAAKAIRDFLEYRDDCEGARVFDDDVADGYAHVQMVRSTAKGKLRPYTFELFWDDRGRRLHLVKAAVFEPGRVLAEAKIPGDMVHPWANAARSMLSDLERTERERAEAKAARSNDRRY